MDQDRASRTTTVTMITISLVIVFSILLLNLSATLNVEIPEVSRSSEKLTNQNALLTLNREPRNLMHFMQISDIHISKFHDMTRVKDFKKFCEEVVPAVRPKLVVASGDLTDAKALTRLDSMQYKEEWLAYKNTLIETNVTQLTKWLDIRGNHDNFNVAGLQSENDLFVNYSVQGKENPRSYMYELAHDDLRYSFIAIDASLEPGPKRPYNFIGLVTKEEIANIEKMVNTSREHGNNFITWFGHYPSSCMSTPTGSPTFRNLIGRYDESVAYLSGHLHTIVHMINRMYTLQNEGFLELELGDFMKNRRFRVAAFDNGLFSFIDTELNENTWPIALITNPKNMLFNNPYKENINLQKDSTHIRMLVFSLAPITKCQLRIDLEPWKDCEKSSTNENFFVVPWNPQKYFRGRHLVELVVGDAEGRTNVIYHDFSLDGSRLNFDFLARFILMIDLTTLFKIFFTITFIFCTFPIIYFRIWHILVRTGKLGKPQIASRFWRRFVQKYWVLASVDRIAFGLLIYCFYMVSCPWSFVELLDGHVGIVFLWGMYLPWKSFLPPNLSYLFGGLQLTFCQFPMVIVLAGAVHKSFLEHLSGIKRQENFKKQFIRHIPFFLIVIAEIVLAGIFWNQYGLLALLISPMRFWGAIFNAYLYYHAANLPHSSLTPAAMIWSSEAKEDATITNN